MKFKILILLLLLQGLLFSKDWQDYFNHLTEDDIEDILDGDDVDRPRVNYKDGLELMPIGTDFDDEFLNDLNKFDPELCVEMLFVLDLPELDDSIESDDDLMMLHLLNNLRAFSKQKGIEYYSHNRGRMHPLFKESYFLFNDKKNKANDPVAKKLPEYEKKYYYQKDTTFGGNVYSLITRSKKDTIWLQMKNTKDWKVYGVKVLNANDVITNFLLYRTEDKVLVYALAQIKKEPKIKRILMLKVNMPGSFKRRIRSMIEWYEKRI